MFVADEFLCFDLCVEFFCADEGAAFDIEEGQCSFAFPSVDGGDVNVGDFCGLLYCVVFLR